MTDTITDHVYLHWPRINLDEIQCYRVRALGYLERLFDIIPLCLSIITATNVAKLAACCDRTAVPALEIIFVVKFSSYWRKYFRGGFYVMATSEWTREMNEMFVKCREGVPTSQICNNLCILRDVLVAAIVTTTCSRANRNCGALRKIGSWTTSFFWQCRKGQATW